LPTWDRPEVRIVFYFPEDIIRLDIRRGVEETPPLARNETTVAHSRQVGWDKHIRTTESPNRGIWGVRSTTETSLFSCLRYPNSIRMTDPSNRLPTLIYEKPKTWGVWTQMYRWYSPQFMHIFGGYRLGHCWWTDNDNRPWPSEPNWTLFRSSFGDDFSSSVWEPRDPWPHYENTPERITNVSGVPPSAIPRCMRTWMLPEFPIPPHFGRNALLYEGYANGGSKTNCYFRVFTPYNLPFTSNSWLQYFICPQQDLGRFVGVDIVCTDGTTLSNSGAVDQRGHSMHPAAGHGGAQGPIPLGQWTRIQCNVGRWLAGKKISMVLVGFDRTGSTGPFRGYIDDYYLQL
jgi:hypothetical protein